MGTTSEVAVPVLWAGVDTGKAEHHCVVIDVGGKRLLSRRVADDENALRKLLSDVVELSDAGPVTWAIDLHSGGAALMIALLTDNGQEALCIRPFTSLAALSITPQAPTRAMGRRGSAITRMPMPS